MKLSKEQKEVIKSGALRFVRVIVPQLPALCAELAKVKPEWVIILSFLGACATALDKMLRDLEVY